MPPDRGFSSPSLPNEKWGVVLFSSHFKHDWSAIQIMFSIFSFKQDSSNACSIGFKGWLLRGASIWKLLHCYLRKGGGSWAPIFKWIQGIMLQHSPLPPLPLLALQIFSFFPQPGSSPLEKQGKGTVWGLWDIPSAIYHVCRNTGTTGCGFFSERRLEEL